MEMCKFSVIFRFVELELTRTQRKSLKHVHLYAMQSVTPEHVYTVVVLLVVTIVGHHFILIFTS